MSDRPRSNPRDLEREYKLLLELLERPDVAEFIRQRPNLTAQIIEALGGRPTRIGPRDFD